jgi:hypothetical protein
VRLAHWYHVWSGGAWQEPLAEHMGALVEATFDHPVYFSVVGDGWEQVTLRKVREYAQEHDGAICYAHTKGGHDTSDFRAAWRRSMTRHVIGGWRENLAALEAYDAVGCHWLTADEFPQVPHVVTTPFFGGNFWIARCDYLRTLPECSTESRFDAERWIGLGNPRVLDLLPGWPGEELFACK